MKITSSTKRFLTVLIAVLILTVVMAGCGVKSSKDSVNALFGSEPATIDPGLCQDFDAGTYIAHAFEGLTRIDNGKIAAGMAESWDISQDGTKYVFHLRNTEWSDGRPIKAQDFEYAWKRALDPETASPYAYIMYYIKNGEEYNSGKATADDVGVKALDDRTLEVELKAQTPFFLELTGFMTYMPVRKDIIEKYGEKWTQSGESYVSNGAFKMKEWVHDDEIVFVKNEDYWGKDKVYLKEVHFKLMSDDAAALSAFESGDLDVNYSHIPPDEIPGLLKTGKAKSYPALAVYFYDFNTTKAPFNDVKVRKAFALAIDRTYIVEKVTMAGQKPATGWVPFGMPGADPEKDFRTETDGKFLPEKANLKEAKKLLSEAGYPDGKGFPEVELIYNTNEGQKKIAEAIQEQLKQNLGVKMKISNMEWDVFVTERNNGNFMLVTDGWGTDYMDPISFLDMWLPDSGNNSTGWQSRQYTGLIKTAQNTGDQKIRMDAMHKAEKILLDEMPVLPLYFYTRTIMENPELKGRYVSPLGIYYLQHAYFAQ